MRVAMIMSRSLRPLARIDEAPGHRLYAVDHRTANTGVSREPWPSEEGERPNRALAVSIVECLVSTGAAIDIGTVALLHARVAPESE